jgi:hypothetical protein
MRCKNLPAYEIRPVLSKFDDLRGEFSAVEDIAPPLAINFRVAARFGFLKTSLIAGACPRQGARKGCLSEAILTYSSAADHPVIGIRVPQRQSQAPT